MAHSSKLLLKSKWSPKRIPNVVAGWDFSRLNLGTDAAVASVPPDIGSVPLIQAVSNNQPIYKPYGINGRGAAYFTTDDFLTADAVAAYAAGNDVPNTILGVFQLDDLGAVQAAVCFGSNPTSARHYLQKNAANLVTVSRRGDGEGANTAALDLEGSFPTTAIAVAVVFTGTKTTVYSGTAMTKVIDDAALDTGTATTINQFTIGCLRIASNTTFMTGHVGACYVATGASDYGSILRFMLWARRKFGTA